MAMHSNSRDVGTDELFRAWIQRYSNDILQTCVLYLSDHALAEDALQDTWIKVYQCLQHQKVPVIHEKAWIMRIAINTCKDYYRTSWFRHVDRKVSIEKLQETTVYAEQPKHMLSMIVMGLPEKYKQVILLYYYQGLTLKETSKVLGVSQTCAFKRLKKAEQLLKQEWIGGAE